MLDAEALGVDEGDGQAEQRPLRRQQQVALRPRAHEGDALDPDEDLRRCRDAKDDAQDSILPTVGCTLASVRLQVLERRVAAARQSIIAAIDEQRLRDHYAAGARTRSDVVESWLAKSEAQEEEREHEDPPRRKQEEHVGHCRVEVGQLAHKDHRLPVDRISSHEDGHLSEEHGGSRIEYEEDK